MRELTEAAADDIYNLYMLKCGWVVSPIMPYPGEGFFFYVGYHTTVKTVLDDHEDRSKALVIQESHSKPTITNNDHLIVSDITTTTSQIVLDLTDPTYLNELKTFIKEHETNGWL